MVGLKISQGNVKTVKTGRMCGLSLSGIRQPWVVKVASAAWHLLRDEVIFAKQGGTKDHDLGD